MKRTLILLLAALSGVAFAAKAAPVIEIDYRRPPKPLNNFWNSTGFSPADVIETPEMKQVLRDVGQLPEIIGVKVGRAVLARVAHTCPPRLLTDAFRFITSARTEKRALPINRLSLGIGMRPQTHSLLIL